MLITKIDKQELVTDPLNYAGANGVFPIYADESAYFAQHIKVNQKDNVADLGTGSGILSIFAAKYAKQVTAFDINERALHFSQFNTYINGVDKKIVFKKQDITKKLTGKYDVILFNPPFNPAPQRVRGKTFSHGGNDGLKITRKVFAQLSSILSKNGTLHMISFSLGKDGKPKLFDEVEKYFSHRKPRITYTHLYPPAQHKKIRYFERIFGSKYSSWYKQFDANPEIFYTFMTVKLDENRMSYKKRKLDVKFPIEKFSGNREARIRRLRMIYRGY